MIGGGPAVVVDTNVFGAELTRRGAALADAYRSHVEGRSLFISFVTVAEISYGARLAQWGQLRLRSLEARLGAAEIVWAGSGLVDAYVSIRRECTVSGHPLGQKQHEADRWVAATARWLDVPLVAHDAVFRDAPGITVISELARLSAAGIMRRLRAGLWWTTTKGARWCARSPGPGRPATRA